MRCRLSKTGKTVYRKNAMRRIMNDIKHYFSWNRIKGIIIDDRKICVLSDAND